MGVGELAGVYSEVEGSSDGADAGAEGTLMEDVGSFE